MLKYPVVVEGKYDKIKLSSFIASPIIVINGFSFFRDTEKQKELTAYNTCGGLIILTDSDKAGIFIRQKLKGFLKTKLINVYVPQVEGKEKRKTEKSKQGLLGVEGISVSVLRSLLLPFAASASEQPKTAYASSARLYSDGLSGSTKCGILRCKLCRELDLPESLSSKALCDALNSCFSEEQYVLVLNKIKEN